VDHPPLPTSRELNADTEPYRKRPAVLR